MAKQNEGELVVEVGMSDERLALLRRTLAADATDDEFALFVEAARRLGLDPFARQIHAVSRIDCDTGKRSTSIQCGIDGFRAVAERTGELDGQDGPFWCGADGVWRDVWAGSHAPVAAKVVVYRKGCSRGFVGLAHAVEYTQRRHGGEPTRMWRTMPALMLAKCAEALALRKAFPSRLSGVYTNDEMAQAETLARSVRRALDRNERTESPPRLEAGVFDAMMSAVRAASSEVELEPLRERARLLWRRLSREQKARTKNALTYATQRVQAGPMRGEAA